MRLIDEKIILLTPKSEQNGCGPKGFGWLVPDQLGLVNIELAGKIHDSHFHWIARYAGAKRYKKTIIGSYLFQEGLFNFTRSLTAGTSLKYANKVFYDNLKTINKEKSKTWLGRQIRKPIIYAYYLAVVKFGKNFVK